MNAQPAAGMPSSHGTLPLFDLRLLWRRKGTFVLCAVLTTALGAVYLVLEEPTYEVSRRLLVEPERLATEESAPAMPSRQFAPTQAELVRSPKVIRRALEKSQFPVPASWSHDQVGYILEALTVVPVVDTSVLKIRFRGKDRATASQFVDALVDCYRELLTEKQSRTVDSLKDLLTQEEQRRHDELRRLQDQHVALLQQSPYPTNLAESARVESEQLMQLTRQLADVQLRRNHLATRLKQVRDFTQTEVARANGGDDPNLVATVSFQEAQRAPSAVSLADSRVGKGLSSEQNLVFELLRDEQGKADGVLSELQRQLTQAHVRKQQLSVQYGPKHDAMRQVEAEIVRLEHLLRDQMASLMDSLQQRLVAEQMAETELAQRCTDQAKEVKALDSFVAQDQALRAELERTEAAYEVVFTQLKEVSLADEAVTTGRGNISVVDLESGNQLPPKVWPLPAPLLAISFVIGCFAALMWIYSGEVIRATAQARGGAEEVVATSLPAVS